MTVSPRNGGTAAADTPQAGRQVHFDFDGRVALVTGAASGIGRATAALFLRSGARLAMADIRADTLAAAAYALDPDSSPVAALAYDAAQVGDARAVVDDSIARFGRLEWATGVAVVRSQVLPQLTEAQAPIDAAQK